MSKAGFYRAFEDRYRGSRELIGERLKVYLPFVQPLHKLVSPANAVDLGCGRGEWLELLQREGFDAHGVDLDEDMLKASRELSLSVQKDEAVNHLKTLDSESMALVTAFHVVEHISFSELQELLVESLRVLKPGGLLILETPNPENVVVATRNFFLDPTHLRPIPPLLLSFVCEYAGFDRIKIVRVQENREIYARTHVNLIDVFEGASPDYAVVAQKTKGSEKSYHFDSAFNAEYGLTMDEISNRYDERFLEIARKIEKIEKKISDPQEFELSSQRADISIANDISGVSCGHIPAPGGEMALIRDLEAVTKSLRVEVEARKRELAITRAEFDSQKEKASAKIKSLDDQLNVAKKNLHDARKLIEVRERSISNSNQVVAAMEASLSWRLTAPLRFILALIIHPQGNSLWRKNLLSKIEKIFYFRKAPARNDVRTTAGLNKDTGKNEMSPHAADIYNKIKKKIK